MAHRTALGHLPSPLGSFQPPSHALLEQPAPSSLQRSVHSRPPHQRVTESSATPHGCDPPKMAPGSCAAEVRRVGGRGLGAAAAPVCTAPWPQRAHRSPRRASRDAGNGPGARRSLSAAPCLAARAGVRLVGLGRARGLAGARAVSAACPRGAERRPPGRGRWTAAPRQPRRLRAAMRVRCEDEALHGGSWPCGDGRGATALVPPGRPASGLVGRLGSWGAPRPEALEVPRGSPCDKWVACEFLAVLLGWAIVHLYVERQHACPSIRSVPLQVFECNLFIIFIVFPLPALFY